MSDTQAAMREFRFLDDKRNVGGLSAAEELRWQELRAFLGMAEQAPQPAYEAAGGYWATDGNWYPYSAYYDANQAWVAQGGYEQAAVDPLSQPYDPSTGYDLDPSAAGVVPAPEFTSEELTEVSADEVMEVDAQDVTSLEEPSPEPPAETSPWFAEAEPTPQFGMPTAPPPEPEPVFEHASPAPVELAAEPPPSTLPEFTLALPPDVLEAAPGPEPMPPTAPPAPAAAPPWTPEVPTAPASLAEPLAEPLAEMVAEVVPLPASPEVSGEPPAEAPEFEVELTPLPTAAAHEVPEMPVELTPPPPATPDPAQGIPAVDLTYAPPDLTAPSEPASVELQIEVTADPPSQVPEPTVRVMSPLLEAPPAAEVPVLGAPEPTRTVNVFELHHPPPQASIDIDVVLDGDASEPVPLAATADFIQGQETVRAPLPADPSLSGSPAEAPMLEPVLDISPVAAAATEEPAEAVPLAPNAHFIDAPELKATGHQPAPAEAEPPPPSWAAAPPELPPLPPEPPPAVLGRIALVQQQQPLPSNLPAAPSPMWNQITQPGFSAAEVTENLRAPVTEELPRAAVLPAGFEPSVAMVRSGDEDLQEIELTEDLIEAPVPAPPPSAKPATFVEGVHRVIIHTLEGQVKRGTVRDVDLLGPAIDLELAQGPESIPQERLKAVFFMMPAGAQPPAEPAGKKIRVTFSDGRQVAGYSTDFRGADPGFFLVPVDNRTNTARIFVFRTAVLSVSPA